jgi:ATP-dependent helicase/nuclease subunit A
MGGGAVTGMKAQPAGSSAQRRASDPRASAWVDASAGTGKTAVLTARVLRLLLDGAAPDRILCITFTRAAAAEMANRIIDRLGQWAVMADGDLVHALFDLTGERPGSEMQTRARQLFARIVDAPAGFRIQTIHAFCQSVLRRFPLEAGIAPHFDLLDDRTQGELLADAQQTLLQDAGREADGPLARALAVLVEHMDERRFAGLIHAILAARQALESALAANFGVALLAQRLWAGLGLRVGETADEILAAACHDDWVDCAGLRAACAVLANASATDQKRAVGILAWIESPDRVAGWSSYLDFHLNSQGSAHGTYTRTKAHKAMAHILGAETDRLIAVCERLRAAQTARATEAMLVVADALFRRYAHAKAIRALLDYDDLIAITRRLLAEQPGWVLYKLDGGVDHLLLDEAQDTNPEQWEIVRALAEEFFAGEGAREQNRTIFVVGDGKQSIYSFQGADPTALKRMQLHFEQRIAAAERAFEPVSLTISYRSTAPVLGLVDAVFADPAAGEGVVDEMSGTLAHGVHRRGEAGLVELWEPFAPPDAGEPAEPWAPPETPGARIDPATELANAVADTIQGWLARGETLASQNRPIAPGDIMILVRRRTRFVAPMVSALKRRGVPVAGVDRLALTEPLAVRDLMALGRFLLLPEDDLTLAALLKSPLIGLDEDQLFHLAHNRGGRLWAALLTAAERDSAAFEPARAWLSALLADTDFSRPFELYARVLAAPCPGDPQGGGRRALWGRLGPDALDPLDEFLAAALDYERRHAPSLEGFIAWLEASDAEIKRELANRDDAVRIVTVHGAKGLEAGIVFLPDTMGTPPSPTGPQLLWQGDGATAIPLWSPRSALRPRICADLADAARRREMREYRRLLYVALTRARDRLYVAGWHGPRKPAEGHWYALIEAGMRRAGAEPVERDGLNVLRLANAEPAAITETTRRSVAEPAPAPPEWTRRPAPAEPRPFRPLTPSRLEMPGLVEPAIRSPATPDDARRFRRGRAMHRLLQILPEIPVAERAAATDRLLPGFTKEERATIATEAFGVIDDPACARFFGPQSQAEVPIVGRIGLRGVTGQIDRLLVEASRITIVDFKSGRVPQGGPDAVPPAYLGQMATYRAILRQIYPDRAIDLVLVWTDGPAVVTLDPAALDPFEAYLVSVPAA